MDKEVCVVGKVVSFKLAAEGKKTNYLNIDKPYPESVFTVVISNYHLEKLNVKIEDLKDATIYIKGKITTYKNDPKQIPQIFNPISIVVKKE
jgi:RPA family protein